MANTVIGVFDSATDAQTAVQHLLSNGFTRDSVDISARNSDSLTDSSLTGSSTSTHYGNDHNESVGDSISNFFSSLFGGSDESKGYSEVARRGSIVTVHADTMQEAERAAMILDQYGAVDVDERAMQYRSGLTGTDTTSRAHTTTDNSAIPIIEEQMHVGKRVVQSGGVRLRSHIIEKPIEESLRLREERVFVERNPVNRAATETDLNTFKEGVIEMTEQTEVPLVSKEARVVEEVRLNKEVQEREETIRDTVRRTDVEVENLGTDDTINRDSTLRRGTDLDDTLNRPGSL